MGCNVRFDSNTMKGPPLIKYDITGLKELLHVVMDKVECLMIVGISKESAD